MTSLPEQFQAARQTQLDKQFQLLRQLGDGALDRTSRLFALNLDASRAAVEHSSNTMRQLLAMRDPRDLLNIGAQTQRQLRTMVDYSRELFSIATGLRGLGLQTWSVEATAPAPVLAAPAAAETAPLKEAEIVADATEAVSASVAQVLSETAPAAAPVAAPAAAPAPEPAHVSVSAAEIAPDTTPVVTSDIAPPVAPTPIAKAASEVLDLPVAPPHPVAASVPVEVAVEIEVPKVEPVEATPPVAVPSGAPKLTEIRGGRGRKKQN